jgi:hypothetical protein
MEYDTFSMGNIGSQIFRQPKALIFYTRKFLDISTFNDKTAAKT